MEIILTISVISIYPYTWKYSVEVNTFEELKTEILKRFGNLIATNKADKEKSKVKSLIRSSGNVEELLKKVNSSERWRLSIEIKK